jgi:hypothetical protein
MTAERTALGSQLIPVTAYIILSAAEAFWRWPDALDHIAADMSPEEIGASGRRPGSRINAVHLWSLANIFLTGRKFLYTLAAVGLVPPLDDPPARTGRLLDFWRRAALAYRGDGHLQAADTGGVLQPYGDDVLTTIVGGARRVDDADDRLALGRLMATLTSHLFLLYFDTRVGTGDSGPYPLGDGRTLLVRDFYWLDGGDFPWGATAAEVPYRYLTAGLVLDGVDVKVNDWGTAVTAPESYLDHLVGFSLFTTDSPDRSLRPVGEDEHAGLLASARGAQAAHYRAIAAMTEAEKIDCGAYVYFTFLRPFAEAAGVADDIDWTVPRDAAGPIYDLVTYPPYET